MHATAWGYLIIIGVSILFLRVGNFNGNDNDEHDEPKDGRHNRDHTAHHGDGVAAPGRCNISSGGRGICLILEDNITNMNVDL